MKFDASKLKNGTLLLIGVVYDRAQPGGDTRGRATPKVYTYGLLKAGGVWYATGMGQTPQAAGWGAVERWLARDGRRLVWVKGTHEEALAELWKVDEETGVVSDNLRNQIRLRQDIERQVDEAIGHGRPIVSQNQVPTDDEWWPDDNDEHPDGTGETL